MSEYTDNFSTCDIQLRIIRAEKGDSMLVLLSFIISILGVLPYLYFAVIGKVRPQRTTWGIWTVLLVLSIVAYKQSGAEESVWFIVGDLIITAAVFVVSLFHGSGGFTQTDRVVLLIALVGSLVWLFSSLPFWQLLGLIVADVVAVFPTIAKVIREPQSESATTFWASSVAAFFGILSVGVWDPVLIIYPLYLYTANLVTAVVITAAQKVTAYENKRRVLYE